MSDDIAAAAANGPASTEVPTQGRGSMLEVLAVATRLGLTSFGGPIAHLGYFRDEYVRRRKWISEDAYADLVALCQFLPGPTSSQVGIAIGIVRAGLPGAVASWLGFTLPSAIVLVAFAFGLERFGATGAGWLHGLKIAAVAVVANAVWGMARSLAPDRARATVAIASAIVVLAWPGAPGQVLVIAIAGLIGWRLLAGSAGEKRVSLPPTVRRRTAVAALAVFFALLGALPLVRPLVASQAFVVFDSFFRVGSLVFGGGHVVLPARAVVHVRRVPRGGHASEAKRHRGSGPRARRDLPADVSPGRRCVAVLERAANPHGVPGGAPRHQRGGGRFAPRRALPPRVDERDQDVGGLRPGPRHVRAARPLERSGMARGRDRRVGGRSARGTMRGKVCAQRGPMFEGRSDAKEYRCRSRCRWLLLRTRRRAGPGRARRSRRR